MRYFLYLFTLAITSTISFSQIYWEPIIEVAPSTFNNKNPTIVLNGSDNPVISWGNGASLFVSTWDGASFTTPISANGPINGVLIGNNYGPEITSHGDTIFGIFKETPASSGNIYVVRSIDGGLTFDPPVQVDNIGSDLSEFVHIKTDDSGNPITSFNRFDSNWGNPRWVVSKSNDFGLTFEPPVVASGWSGGGNVVCECCPADIAVKGQTTLLAYRDNLSNIRDNWIGISNDGGNSFTAGMDVDQTGWMIMSCPTTGPSIEIVGDTLYSAFMSAANGTSLIYYSKASISSATGIASEELTGYFQGLANQNYPKISIDSGKGVIVWQQSGSGNIQTVLSLSEDISGGFPSIYDTVVPQYSANPDVVMKGNEIHVVWRDYSEGTVKYRKGIISGVGLTELQENSKKKVIKITDLSGREVEFNFQTPLILFYEDGTSERIMRIKE